MTTMIVRHKVNNYENWKRAYDEFASTRKEKGVTGASVFRDPEDENLIIVTHNFKNLNAAQAFADSNELKSAMHDAGVAGRPTIWFGEDIERTAF